MMSVNALGLVRRSWIFRVGLMGAVLAGMSLQASAQSGSRSGGRSYAPGRSYQPGRSNPQFRPDSGTRARSGSGTRVQPGSSTRELSNVALDGYCPVCIIDMKQWMRGNPQYQAAYDGKTYVFPNEQIKQTFLENPGKYVPALGGDCTVCLAKMNKRVPGSVFHAAYHKGRLYLFPGDDQKQMFLGNPEEFANVDVVLEGNCSVCLVEMNQTVAGKPEFAAFHGGMRYLFPSADQLRMFHANPQKYVTGGGDIAAPPGAAPQSSTSFKPETNFKQETKTVTVTGTSTCAGCEHGVVPIGAPDTLGLGIETPDGRLYVIEDSHKQYPEVYASRFQKLKLTVTGNVLKEEGLVTWLTPAKLAVIQ